MRKLLILLLIFILVFSACSSEDKDSEEETDENEDTEESEDEDSEETDAVKEDAAPEVIPEKTIEELLEDAEKQQLAIFQDRGEVFIQKREILDEFHDPELDFETRQIYQDALDIIKVRESELTLAATIIEKKIRALKDSLEGKEVADAYTNTLEELREERQEFMDRLPALSKEIIDVRVRWSVEEMTPENFEDMQAELKPLEDEEEEILYRIADIDEEIADKEEYVAALSDYEYDPDSEDILVRRWAASEELKVVQNDLVQMYLKLKDATGEEAETLEKYIDDLKNKESSLANQLSNIDTELRES